jgi:hypothetical protein
MFFSAKIITFGGLALAGRASGGKPAARGNLLIFSQKIITFGGLAPAGRAPGGKSAARGNLLIFSLVCGLVF